MPIEIHQLTINSHLGDTEKKTSGTKETIADAGGASSKKEKESGGGVSVRELNRYLADFKQDLLEEWRRSMRNYLGRAERSLVAIVSLGEKELLEITACSVDASGTVTVDEDDKFSVMINPTSYKREQSIAYNNGRIIGEIGSRRRFCRVDQDNVSFEIILDGTGVVTTSDEATVEERVNSLSAILGYDGSEHEPKHSRLVWGSLLFYGRMSAMNIDYSLFKPSGEPLRATVKLNFVRFMTAEEESQEANRSSPDLSHIVEVKAGDTLPLLCHRVYKDSSYYAEVATVNKLDNFRDLAPGLKLIFPPLK